MKFKHYIQSEINQKEIEPSHDAWDRIQARMENQPKIVENSNQKKWWTIAAAIIGLIVCTTIYFVSEPNVQPIEVVNHQNKIGYKIPLDSNVQHQKSTEILKEVEVTKQPELANSKTSTNHKIEEATIQQEQLVSNPEVESFNIKEDQPQTIQKPSLATGFNQNQIKLATNLDTVEIKQKKKNANYVDPNMLLYSIENKDALKETQKEKTRVAVIDLNK